jgi:hypothetical protein
VVLTTKRALQIFVIVKALAIVTFILESRAAPNDTPTTPSSISR